MISQLLSRYPSTGYISSAFATSAGLLNIFAHVQAVLGIVSLLIGIVVGSLTAWIQWQKIRRG